MNKPGLGEATIHDYEQIKIVAYERQDRIVAALTKAGIDPWDAITALALSYHMAQILGRAEARALREAKKVGIF